MAAQPLDPTGWKSFAKGKGYKDGLLVKALEAFAAAAEAQPQIEALDEIEEQVAALLKSAKGDKALEQRVSEMAKALRLERKAAKELAKKEKGQDGDKPEPPEVLTSRLLTLLRLVRKGQPMHAMIALKGKTCALLLSRKPPAPPLRKVLATYLGATGGVKYFPANCVFEDNSLTFVMPSAIGGLSKKLQVALLAQIEQRIKVRVRGQNPKDLARDI